MQNLYAVLILAGLGWLVWQSFRPRRNGARAATSDTSGSVFGTCDGGHGGGDGGHAACGEGGGGDGGSCGGD